MSDNAKTPAQTKFPGNGLRMGRLQNGTIGAYRLFINFFPPHQHEQVRIELSSLLKGVISLRLLPRQDMPGRIPAYEVMLLTPTIARLIREGKIWEIPKFMEEGDIFGMCSFNQSLLKLVSEGKVNQDIAAKFSDNKDEFMLTMKGIKGA